ncbi:DUF3156 family protein [Desulfobacter curvatus]|uniref:DUF3156 family protein n=1 Tax=Desulfobacter curvatus TaxID=2290 RepID=UPI0003669459|nr:DUF3156 family protein [Desulfobacter curvatus]
MKSNSKLLDRAGNAILSTSRYFIPLWGDIEMTDSGEVEFTELPQSITGLRITFTKKQQWLGGTVLIHFYLQKEITINDVFSVHYSNTRFVCKFKTSYGALLTQMLNTDKSLRADLRKLDLTDLVITTAEGKLNIKLTPYGGGLAFLSFPPVKYAVAFPPEQAPVTARVMERLSGIIELAHQTWN